MKKACYIVTACVAGIVLILITTLAFVKPQPSFVFDDPDYIKPYNNSAVALNSGNGYGLTSVTKPTTTETKYTSKEQSTYKELLQLVQKMLKTSALTNLYHTGKVAPRVGQDINNKLDTLSSNVVSNYYCIELRFASDHEQSQTVYVNGDSKVIRYYGAFILLNKNSKKGYQEVPVYFVTSSSNTSIASYSKSPMLTYANTTKLIKYIEKLTPAK